MFSREVSDNLARFGTPIGQLRLPCKDGVSVSEFAKMANHHGRENHQSRIRSYPLGIMFLV